MRKYLGLIKVIIICMLIAGVGIYLYSLRIKEYRFSGNSLRYSHEELQELIFASELEKNPIYYWLFADKDKQIPFIAKYDVEIDFPDKAEITVYGKDVIGYVYYKDFYFYFDSDGIVVESSPNLLEGVILIEGLEFNSMVLNRKLPVENKEIFNLILSLTKMIKNGEVIANVVDKIEFDKELNINLYIDNIQVKLGKDEFLDDKISKVEDVFPDIKGMTGTLNMEAYNDTNDYFWFRTAE
ncbi:MAG: hypothetical protein IJW18_07060 [Lachnospiraceae bacterium]|nr:hypothetical protein [Lachnospiraceae bacterium]